MGLLMSLAVLTAVVGYVFLLLSARVYSTFFRSKTPVTADASERSYRAVCGVAAFSVLIIGAVIILTTVGLALSVHPVLGVVALFATGGIVAGITENFL